MPFAGAQAQNLWRAGSVSDRRKRLAQPVASLLLLLEHNQDKHGPLLGRELGRSPFRAARVSQAYSQLVFHHFINPEDRLLLLRRREVQMLRSLLGIDLVRTLLLPIIIKVPFDEKLVALEG